MTHVFLSYLLISLIGTVAALVFLLIRPLTKKYFSPSWHYYAWIIVLVVMMVPLRFNIQENTIEKIKPMEETTQVVLDASWEKEVDRVTENEYAAPYKSENAKTEEVEEEKPQYVNFAEEKKAEITPQRKIDNILFFENCKNFFQRNVELFAYIWLWGMIVIFAYKFIKYKIFLKNIVKNSTKVQIDGIQEKIEVRVIKNVKSPFVIKWLNPILVLPDKELSETHMRNILAHELTHVKRHDIIYKWVVAICKGVHWFNPFMHLIAKQIERDCEISCDEVVVKNMNDTQKKSYADTILSFAFEYGRNNPLTTSMATGKQTLKGRLVAIKNSKRKSKINAVISVFAVLVFFINFIVVSGFTGGALLPVSAEDSDMDLGIGDYVTLGKYNGEDIVWRYVADDENGKLFWSDKFIGKKPFGENDNWEQSAIRAWLNSDAQFMNIESEQKGIVNAYNTNSGFLYDSNFTDAEKSLIKEANLRNTYYKGWDLTTGKLLSYGVKKNFWDEEDESNREYYLNMKSTWTVDNVFLLDLEQLRSVQENIDILGNLFTDVESMCGEADSDDKYFTRTPLDGGYITGSHPLESGYHGRVYTICNHVSEVYNTYDFVLDGYSYTYGWYFVRPGFYLNEENMIILSGNGTKEKPFVIDGKSAPNRFEENSLYGYKDNEGNIIVPPKYLKAGDFYENAALVILPENPYELRVITNDGTYLFDKAFSAVNNFESGYALVRANEKGEYSYINKSGELATELLFEDAGNFERGLARVILDGKSGVIDTKFNFYPDEIGNNYSVVKVFEGYKVTFVSGEEIFFEKVYENKPAVRAVKDGIYKITYRNYYNNNCVQFVDAASQSVIPHEYRDIIYANGKYAVSKEYSMLHVYDIFTGETYEIERNFASDDTHLEISISDDTMHLIYTVKTGWNKYEGREEYIPLTDDLKVQ